jgi:hypothetical protein
MIAVSGKVRPEADSTRFACSCRFRCLSSRLLLARASEKYGNLLVFPISCWTLTLFDRTDEYNHEYYQVVVVFLLSFCWVHSQANELGGQYN